MSPRTPTVAAALLIAGLGIHPLGARADTAINGLVYADFSDKQNQDKATGAKSSDSGVGTDVKRFYFTVTHEFDSVWSAQFQTDIGDQGAKRYDVFVKKAYVKARLDPLVTAAGAIPVVAPVVAAAEPPESVSRFNRCRSARTSAALW